MHDDSNLIMGRALSVFRSRYVEDRLFLESEMGPVQYVILGAGLDSFALRLPDSHNQIRISEVDHPNTQNWKRNKLRELGMTNRPGPIFIDVDFESEGFKGKLLSSGFDPDLPTLFSLLGVSYYLTREALLSTYWKLDLRCAARRHSADVGDTLSKH